MGHTKYTSEHEWVRSEQDGTLTVGITDYAQAQLGDIVFVELPEVGRRVAAGEEVVVIESVKAAADIKTPVGGEVVAVNDALAEAPETVNEDPMQSGWFLRIRPDRPEEIEDLLDESQYQSLIGQ